MSPLNNYNLQGMLGPYAPMVLGGQSVAQPQAYSPIQQQPPAYQYGGYAPQMPMVMMMFAMFQSMMQMMFAMFQTKFASADNGSTVAPANTEPSTPPAYEEPQSYTPPVEEPPVYEQPPAYEPPVYEEPPAYEPPVYEEPPVSEPPVYEEPPAYEPPVYEEPKLMGSAGLYGDPKFGLFTPELSELLGGLVEFESGILPGQTVTLLDDADQGGLQIQATAVQVDPNNAASSGIGSATFKSGSDTIVINGNGDLTVNGIVKGNINDDGNIAPIQLANGVTVSSSQQVDGADGATAERFVITNGEYKITAAPRLPHAEATPYLDMNFEELTATAADNATGYQTSVPGMTEPLGIPDLLRLEVSNFSFTA